MKVQSPLYRFRLVRLSTELQTEFEVPALICANPEGMPFVEGQHFYAWLIEYNGCQPTTAHTYVKSMLQFLTFLWFRSPPLSYSAPAHQIRQEIDHYLQEKLGCMIRPGHYGNLLVIGPKMVTKHTVRLYLVAFRHFYEFVRARGLYSDVNPLIWLDRPAFPEPPFQPAMRLQSGLTQPEERAGRLPEMYFCVVADEWQPRILDDPHLPQKLVVAFPTRRDQLITRILFESGARIGEILALSRGDWRGLVGQRHGALATNKGAWGERVKEIWWSSETSQHLRLYLNGERCQHDPYRRRIEDLPDTVPLFLTEQGEPYRYPAFYYHWRKACAQAGVKLHPHQARHWFVTMALRRIQALPDEEQRDSYRQGLITYMHWKNPETIKVYDHHLHLSDFTAVHAAIGDLLRSTPTTLAPTSPEVKGETADVSPETWAQISQLLIDEQEAG